MLKRTLPIYFITISILTTLIIVTIGLLVSFIGRNYSFDRFYYFNKRIDTNLYLQMMDREIPGSLVEKKENDLFSTILDPIMLLKTEIPGFRYYDSDAGSTEVKDEPKDIIGPAKQSNIKSLLPDQAPKRVKTDIASSYSKRPAVFIYHTHNRESWISEVKDKSEGDVKDPSRNITLVGKFFADKLDKIGIPVVLDQTDHTGILQKKDQKYYLSYAISAETVEAAMKQNPQIEYIFDFHRDSISRKMTTTTIDGETYAKIMFVIGKHNQHWQENLDFATKLQAILDKKYPGLCRPIVTYPKGTSHNGEYNQSLSSNALTVEIGGIGNTLEESQKTIGLLADAFAELYLEAVPVFNQEEER